MCASRFAFDGQYYKPLKRHLTARSDLLYDKELGVDFKDVRDEYRLTDLCICIWCGCDVLSLALVHGMKPYSSDHLTSGLFIVIESLRNAWAALFDCAPGFLTRCVSYREDTVPEPWARALWTCLGVDIRMMELFVHVMPLFQGGELVVAKSLESDLAGFTKINGAVVYSLRWRKLAATRWIGAQACLQMFALSLICGIQGLVSVVLQDGDLRIPF